MAAGLKYPLSELEQIITDLIATARWSSAVVRLFVADITPSVGDTVGTYTGSEAAWTGYAAQAAIWGVPGVDATHGYVDSAVLSYTVTSGGTGTTVYGYFITDVGGVNLLVAERVASPVSVLDGFPVPLQVRLRDVNV